MSQLQSTGRFSDLIGVGGPAIRWGRVLALFSALLISGLVSNMVSRTLAKWTLVKWTLDIWQGLGYSVVVCVLTTLCMVLFFRLIRNEAAALIVAALMLSALSQSAFWLFFGGMPHKPLEVLVVVLRGLTWRLPLMAGLCLFVRWIKPFWLGLGAGALAGLVTSELIWIVRDTLQWSLSSIAWEFELYSLLDHLVYATLLAAVLWAGLQAAETPRGHVSKRVYLWSVAWAGGLADALALLVARLVDRPGHPSFETNELLIIGSAFLLATALVIYAAVMVSVLLYKAWKAIQDGHARTTPGKAIGFLFIPLFSFYWAFQVFWGLARDYNRFVERHGLNAAKLPAGVFLAHVIVACVISILPLAPIPASLPVLAAVLSSIMPLELVLFLIVVSTTCDAINAIPESLRLSFSRAGHP